MRRHLSLLLILTSYVNLSVAQDLAVNPRTATQQQWQDIEGPLGNIRAYTAFPSQELHNEVIVVIHDENGLNDFVKSVTDKIALEGFRVMAPKLPGYEVDQLKAVTAYIDKIVKDEERIYLLGFGKGGTAALDYADETSDLQGLIIFYAPLPDDMGNITVPVFAMYGNDDDELSEEIQSDMNRMKMLGEKFSVQIFPGATHNFMQKGGDPDASAQNQHAYNEGWQAIMRVLGY